ncbi:MAG: hypothetical protein JXO22_08040, partial [Phycisphaerae bacterium]|nr:hypothetical protein [Phycisphaerae bacterium]
FGIYPLTSARARTADPATARRALIGDTESLPAQFDWRDYGGCPPVRNQGACGSCWAFGTVGPLECNIVIKEGIEVDLSEQWLVSCNQSGFDCVGGWWAHDYHQDRPGLCGDSGAVLEADYPYEAQASPCNCPNQHPYRIADWAYIGTGRALPSVENIKQAILDYGPVSATVYTNGAFFAYRGGIFNACDNPNLNHAVTIVGWDDTQGTAGVWIVRNSWGPNWGEDGYMRIEYECLDIGNAACYVDYQPQRGLRASPPVGIDADGPRGGPFTNASIAYTLENVGDDEIAFAAFSDVDWISLADTAGVLNGLSAITIEAALNDAAALLPNGRHEAALHFVNTTDHVGDTTRTIVLDVGVPAVVHEWSMDIDPGWTGEGLWAWGQPLGAGGAYGFPDPNSGYSGPNIFGYNLAGDYEPRLAETHLTSDAIDCTGLNDVHVRFRRWLGVEDGRFDHAYLHVSNDGVTWHRAWENTSEVADGRWTLRDYNVANVADNQPTVYLRWTMGTTDIIWQYCGWNIDDVEIVARGGPATPLEIAFPDGLPTYAERNAPTPVVVQIIDGTETCQPNTATLHYRLTDGPFDSTPLTAIGGNLYQATLPPANCGDEVEYYIGVTGDGGSEVLSPRNAPLARHELAIGSLQVAFADDFSTDAGWSVTGNAEAGYWERGIPVNDQRGDPPTDHDGSRWCYVTANRAGDADVDEGSTILTSPPFDMQRGGVIHYAYWLNDMPEGEIGREDSMKVEVSTDEAGLTWKTVRTYTVASALWRTDQIPVGQEISASPIVRLRIVVADKSPGDVIEAAIDAVQASRFICTAGTGDVDCDGIIGVDDVDAFVLAIVNPPGYAAALPACDRLLADCNGDGMVDIFDVDAFVALITR